jgi:magnesium-transporting ATPase (P-type)
MGTITEICTGKTATLTKNEMSVNSFYTAGQFIRNSTNTTFVESGLHPNVIEIIKDCIILNCDARVEMSEDARYEPTGNGTEAGLLKFLQLNEFAIQDLLTQRQRLGLVETGIPFGPIRKRQLVAIRPSPTTDYVRVVVKGAPEYILPFCSY